MRGIRTGVRRAGTWSTGFAAIIVVVVCAAMPAAPAATGPAGTRVAHGGKGITYLTAATTGEKATGSWTSPATGIKYGSGWKVTVPGGRLTVTPDLRNQEVDLLKTQGILYWEGDVTIKGKIGGTTISGDGYTELLPPGF